MRIFGFALAVIYLLTPMSAAVAAPRDETVVLLHGMARGRATMAPLETYLRFQGYRTLNIAYASREKSIDDLLVDVHVQIERAKIANNQPLHFVGYSMGGLLVDAYIARYAPANLGRVVMIGTPNQGSEVADTLGRYETYHRFFGPAGGDLRTTAPRADTPRNYEVGVIAGSLSVDPISSLILIPGRDDGKVAIKNTRLSGMRDHITLPTTHVFMMNNPFVIKQAARFIASGTFDHEKPVHSAAAYNQ